MDLYFLRHGKAEERAYGKEDFERRLVERGVADVTLVAQRLKSAAISFDAVYTSPYPRAHETAKIVATTLNLTSHLTVRTEIRSGWFRIGELQALTSAHSSRESILFVGHEPDLSTIIEQLCGARCDMKTSSLACISVARPEPGYGVLQWLLSPRILSTDADP